jgi:tetratricopeptide (TPR) repeat protein
VTVTTPSKVRRRRSLRNPSTPQTDSALLTEARALIAARKWRAALDVLEACRETHPQQDQVDELMAVAAAHAGRKKTRDAAFARLSDSGPGATGWEAIAAAHLASGQYAEADHAAREALELRPGAPGAWGSLATSFAGLGWFEEAGDCLGRCDRVGGLNPLARWQLGQSINRWAMGRSHAPLVALLGTILLGNILLGLAFAFTAPVAVREFRVSRLDPRFRSVAEEAWRTDHVTRLCYGTIVLTLISAWVFLLVRYQP